MKNKSFHISELSRKGLHLLVPTFLFWIQGSSLDAFAQRVGPVDVPEEREIHNTFTGKQQKGALLDATNPIDLINRLRRASAMDNATPPSDAIDEALQAFDESPTID